VPSQLLDITSESPRVAALRTVIESRIVGQVKPIDELAGMMEKFYSGLYDSAKPIASVLLVGPSGAGKTRLTEAFVEGLYGDKRHCLKIDCAEFQHSHEISKLIGSPPGYHGHRTTPPLFNNERVSGLYTEECPFTVLVFDEIEKASDALWHLLLGVLDKGIVTNGYNEVVDLTRTIILMTSNAGTPEMNVAMGGGNGFKVRSNDQGDAARSAKQVGDIGIAAAKRKFTTEFIGRLDAVIACHALTRQECLDVIYKELGLLHEQVYQLTDQQLDFVFTRAVPEAILEEGYDPRYGARNLKNVINHRIQLPLGRIISTRQYVGHSFIEVDFTPPNYTFTPLSEEDL
jgi:ATP-dependent Clp protease ATP-binding subunit ClpB